MTTKQIEEKMIELKHRRPFVPFVVEMADGQLVQVPNAGLAITDTGMGFLSENDGLVDVDFSKVKSIRLPSPEVVA